MSSVESTRPAPILRRGLSFLLKAGVSVGALLLIALRVDVPAAVAQLTQPKLNLLAAAFSVLLLQWPLTAARFWLLSNRAGAGLTPGRALSVQLASLLMNQAVPTIGGDAWRTLALRRMGTRLRAAVDVAIVDRYFALLGLSAIVIVGQPWFQSLPRDSPVHGAASLGLAFVLVALALLATTDKWLPQSQLRVLQMAAEIGPVVRRCLGRGRVAAPALGCSIAAHLVTVVVVFLIAGALRVDFELAESALLVPPIVLLSALPISVAGWGVREGSSIAMFSLAGTDAQSSVAIAVLLGLLQLAVSLPGVAAILVERRRAHQAP